MYLCTFLCGVDNDRFGFEFMANFNLILYEWESIVILRFGYGLILFNSVHINLFIMDSYSLSALLFWIWNLCNLHAERFNKQHTLLKCCYEETCVSIMHAFVPAHIYYNLIIYLIKFQIQSNWELWCAILVKFKPHSRGHLKCKRVAKCRKVYNTSTDHA